MGLEGFLEEVVDSEVLVGSAWRGMGGLGSTASGRGSSGNSGVNH